MQKIYHDLFHIAERILQIDPFYEIFWNGEFARFEVFWHGKLAFVVPFDALDVFEAQAKKIQAMKAKIKDYVKYDYERFN